LIVRLLLVSLHQPNNTNAHSTISAPHHHSSTCVLLSPSWPSRPSLLLLLSARSTLLPTSMSTLSRSTREPTGVLLSVTLARFFASLTPQPTTATRPPLSTLASARTAPPPVSSTMSRLCLLSSAKRPSRIASPPMLATRTARITAPILLGPSAVPSTPRLTRHLVLPPRLRPLPPTLPLELAALLLAPPRLPAAPARLPGPPRLPTLPATATLLPLLPLVSSPTCSRRLHFHITATWSCN
ncbi:hypothetical protein CI238_02873, partial [Colletotrichum incanum]